jgi:hypothetical protein
MLSKISGEGGMWQKNHETMLVAVADSQYPDHPPPPHPLPKNFYKKRYILLVYIV